MPKIYPPKPLIFGRPNAETMTALSSSALERFIERTIKREKSGYFLPYVLCLTFGWLGGHRLYLRQYLWAAAVFIASVGLTGLSIAVPAMAKVALILAWCLLAFEALSLWWFIRRFNIMNEAQIRSTYAASTF